MPNQSYADNIDGARDGQSQIPQLNANFPGIGAIPVVSKPSGFFSADLYYTLAEVADKFGVTVEHARDWINETNIPYRKIPGGRLILFADLVAHLPAASGPEQPKGAGKRRKK